MYEEPLFKYLHLLNEARAIDIHDEELYKRQQKVCDAIEKELGIQEPVKPVINNYYTTNNCCESVSSKDVEKRIINALKMSQL